MSVRVLVTGAAGMLAGHLVPKLIDAQYDVQLSELRPQERFGKAVRGVDITRAADVNDLVRESAPAWIINCAAYTAVDKAETERELCFRVNADGVKHLALAAKASGARLLHISTDYVFGGPLHENAHEPILEEAETNPCGIYGLSKECGESFAKVILPEGLCLVRTSWLHGVQEPNFIASILRLISGRDELKVVDDQIGSPTWAAWLADVLLALVEREARGVFHACSNGGISWCEFAREIARQVRSKTKILPQTTAELNRPAPRPAYSVLSNSKLERFLGRACPDWRSGVEEHLKQIGAI